MTGHEHGLTNTWSVSSFLDQKFDQRSLSPNFGIDHIVVAPKNECECSESLLPHMEHRPRPIWRCDLSLVCPSWLDSANIRLGLYREIVAASGSIPSSYDAHAAESMDHVGFGKLAASSAEFSPESPGILHVFRPFPFRVKLIL
jgi:hypothetical protein